MNKLAKAYQIAQTADVSTPPDSVVLYSISYLPTNENKVNALAYLKKNPQAMMLDDTPCGRQLMDLGLETGNEAPDAEILKIWAIASARFIAAAAGNLTAFVAHASPKSTFVSVELPHILRNEKIITLNGEDKFLFAARFGVTEKSN